MSLRGLSVNENLISVASQFGKYSWANCAMANVQGPNSVPDSGVLLQVPPPYPSRASVSYANLMIHNVICAGGQYAQPNL